ncbi:MAG TPA: NAD(P)-dependent oxidoreductase [Solirubrobacteraceae bacterium]|nr:NAD(P)-dependent oxidoreductase [Solirubrobacteraceae bacterium]
MRADSRRGPLMRVFLAGATGVIGRVLLPQLIRSGHDVVAMTRAAERRDELRAAGAEPVVCDALDAEALRTAVTAARPQAVIHQLTSLPSRLEPRKYATQLAATNRLRREGTGNLVAAAQAAGAERIVAQSIAFAYAPEGGWVKDEGAPLGLALPPPMSEAIGAVAELERQVLEAGGTVLRYGYLYGPQTGFHPDGYYAELARKRQFPIVGSGQGRWSFVHVDDAAEATVAALERGEPGVYNVVDDEPAPVSDWVPVFAESVGAKRPFRVPAWLARLIAGRVAVAGMTAQRGASNAKAKSELGWAPTHATWRDGFRATPAG